MPSEQILNEKGCNNRAPVQIAENVLESSQIEMEPSNGHPQSTTSIEDLLLDQSDKESPNNILSALNDDCLLSVFRVLKMPAIRIVADVCVRFNDIAKDVFRLKYQQEEIRLDVGMDETFFKNFGSSIKRLKFDHEITSACSESQVFDMNTFVDKYCVNLTEFKFTMNGKVSVRPHRVLARITDLVVKNYSTISSDGHNANEIISSCPQMKSLSIHHITEEKCLTKCSLPRISFQNLTRIRIENFCSISMNHFKAFLFANPRLSDIALVRCSWNSFEMFQLIKENRPNIMRIQINECELESGNCKIHKVEIKMRDKDSEIEPSHFRIFYRFYSPLGRLSPSPLPVLLEILDKNVTVDELYVLGRKMCDESLEVVSKLKIISALSISVGNFREENMIFLLKTLPNLTQIRMTFEQKNVTSNVTNLIKQFLLCGRQLTKILIVLYARYSTASLTLDETFNENDHDYLLRVIEKREKVAIAIRYVSLSSSITANCYDYGNDLILTTDVRGWLSITQVTPAR